MFKVGYLFSGIISGFLFSLQRRTKSKPGNKRCKNQIPAHCQSL
jgi:hypothetical protein